MEATEGRLAGYRLTARALRRQQQDEQAARERYARGEITSQQMQDELSKWADEDYLRQLAQDDEQATEAARQQLQAAQDAENAALRDYAAVRATLIAAQASLSQERTAQDGRIAALQDCENAGLPLPKLPKTRTAEPPDDGLPLPQTPERPGAGGSPDTTSPPEGYAGPGAPSSASIDLQDILAAGEAAAQGMNNVARNTVSNMSTSEKLAEALRRAIESDRVPQKTKDALLGLATPKGVATLALVAAVFGAAQLFPGTWVVDVAVAADLLLQLGPSAIDVASALYTVYNATEDWQLDSAADDLANAVVNYGVGKLFKWGHGIFGGEGSSGETAEPTPADNSAAPAPGKPAEPDPLSESGATKVTGGTQAPDQPFKLPDYGDFGPPKSGGQHTPDGALGDGEPPDVPLPPSSSPGRIISPVKTLPDGSVSVEYQVGDPIERQGMENMIPTSPGMHRGHLVPPGHGVEDPGGLAYNTPEVNLSVDQRIDNRIRDIYQAAKGDGNQVHVTAQMKRGDNMQILSKDIEVELVRPDGTSDTVFRTGYGVDSSGKVVDEYFSPGPAWTDPQ
jgi:hypothetical protein